MGNYPNKTSIDLSVNESQVKDVSNTITARENRGISNRKSEGTGVIEKNNGVDDSKLY